MFLYNTILEKMGQNLLHYIRDSPQLVGGSVNYTGNQTLRRKGRNNPPLHIIYPLRPILIFEYVTYSSALDALSSKSSLKGLFSSIVMIGAFRYISFSDS